MNHFLVLFTCLAIGFADRKDVISKPRKPASIVIGYIHDGVAFAVSNGISQKESDENKVEIQKLKLSEIQVHRASVDKYHYHELIGQNVPYRWRIANNSYWATGSEVDLAGARRMWRIPLDDLGLFGKSKEEREKEFKRKYPAGKWEGDLEQWEFGVHAWYLQPIVDEVEGYLDQLDRESGELGQLTSRPIRGQGSGRLGGMGDPSIRVRGIYFDFLPVGEKEIELFILKDKVMCIWQGRGKFEPKGSQKDAKRAKAESENQVNQRPWAGWDVKWSRRPVEQFRVPFKEPFIVYDRYPRYFFVTQSGKLFVSEKEYREPRRTKHVWQAPEPIHALITDTATRKTFAFAMTITVKPPEKGKPTLAYFELGDKEIGREYFDPKLIKPVKAPRAPQDRAGVHTDPHRGWKD